MSSRYQSSGGRYRAFCDSSADVRWVGYYLDFDIAVLDILPLSSCQHDAFDDALMAAMMFVQLRLAELARCASRANVQARFQSNWCITWTGVCTPTALMRIASTRVHPCLGSSRMAPEGFSLIAGVVL
jgi:hypothetical protein